MVQEPQLYSGTSDLKSAFYLMHNSFLLQLYNVTCMYSNGVHLHMGVSSERMRISSTFYLIIWVVCVFVPMSTKQFAILMRNVLLEEPMVLG